MTPTTSSEPFFSAKDYAEYLRCPRTAHLRLTGELADSSPLLPVSSDREHVREAARAELSFPADSVFDLRLERPPFVAAADVWHRQRPEGMAAAVFREATGLKRLYLFESMFILLCAGSAEAEPVRLYIYHLNKDFVRRDGEHAGELFIASDVTRRARQLLAQHQRRLDDLGSRLASDPFLEAFRHTPCDRPHRCAVCSQESDPVPEHGIRTLYRGGDLVGELESLGYQSIPDVPESLLPHPRQRIQRAAIISGEPQVDMDSLGEFVGNLTYPLHYLDFEAFSYAVPRHAGTRPWEHVPYLFSVHTEREPGAAAEHVAFIMQPPLDQRDELITSLITAVEGPGNIVVYGAPFETGVLERLGVQFPQYAEDIDDVVARIVDLFLPFKEFVYYDARQRGKTSLKAVLPVFSGDLYEGLPVKDGYTANIAYRYLEERARDRDSPDRSGFAGLSAHDLGESLVRYCATDTIAMVEILARIRDLVSGRDIAVRGDL